MAIMDDEWERLCRSAYSARGGTAAGGAALVNYLNMANAGHCSREEALLAAAAGLAEMADTLAARLTDAIMKQAPSTITVGGRDYEPVPEAFRAPMDKATGR